MFRLFDMLGRSTAMRALDDALRAAGLHPLLVPEPVKLTVIQLHKTHAAPAAQGGGITDAAQLLAYCILRACECIEDAKERPLKTLGKFPSDRV